MERECRLYHIIFQTRDIGMALPQIHRGDFYNLIALLFTNRRCPVYAIGGGMNHIHIIVGVPINKSLKPLIDKVRVISHTKAHKILDIDSFCGWLKGTMLYTIEKSRLPYWVDYVENQEAIHSDISWLQEKQRFMNYNLI